MDHSSSRSLNLGKLDKALLGLEVPFASANLAFSALRVDSMVVQDVLVCMLFCLEVEVYVSPRPSHTSERFWYSGFFQSGGLMKTDQMHALRFIPL